MYGRPKFGKRLQIPLDGLGAYRPHWRIPPRPPPGGVASRRVAKKLSLVQGPFSKGRLVDLRRGRNSLVPLVPPAPAGAAFIRVSEARLSPLCPFDFMKNVSDFYLALWFILTRPGLVVSLDNGHLLKYDQEKACILYHNPHAKKQTGWYLSRGAMTWAKQYRLASVDTINWTLSPYSEEDMARFLYEQGLSWWRP